MPLAILNAGADVFVVACIWQIEELQDGAAVIERSEVIQARYPSGSLFNAALDCFSTFDKHPKFNGDCFDNVKASVVWDLRRGFSIKRHGFPKNAID